MLRITQWLKQWHWLHDWSRWRVVAQVDYFIWQERECAQCGLKERRQEP